MPKWRLPGRSRRVMLLTDQCCHNRLDDFIRLHANLFVGGVPDLMRSALQPETGHHAIITIKASLDMKRFPRTLFFEFGEATGAFAARAEAGALDFAGSSAADVVHQ